MFLKLSFRTFLFAMPVLFAGCASVQKHNEKRLKPIPVAQLQEDIDYVQNKLIKLHPGSDLYITKEQLAFKFDSIRKVVNKPMTSNEFYTVISPVVASVRQGHMAMMPMSVKLTKEQQKKYKQAGDGPLSQFKFEWENNKLYILKNNSNVKEIKEGTEVLSIKDRKPQEIYAKYKASVTSDGYNTTFLWKYFNKRFTTFLTEEIGFNDSLSFTLKYKDSVYDKMICRKKKDKKENKPLTEKQEERLVTKDIIKKKNKNKRIFGYDEKTKEFSKSLRFIGKDTTVAYLKINDFVDGNFKKAYKVIFDSIKKSGSKTLVMDLRDNPGGRMSEILNLYSYLTPEDFIMTEPAVVTSKTSLWKLGLFPRVPKLAYPFIGAFYPVYMGVSYFKVKKGDDGKYYYHLSASKTQKHNPNHFNGKVYVLINGGSFSASCIISSALKANKDITFVGEETGGDFNGTVAGIMPVLKLPNSEIQWRLGLMHIKPVKQTDVKGHGIYPDKEIIQTIEDKVNKKDPELEWILNDIYK
ncbi:S41 family peptidase [Flavobacterium amniphilum]|uniref:S41 family peptidase n=1 Tax=Flavobacterium amniphilum TaxID=1834035 RepID=UPI00202A12FC|nr:S41 family peptidase [Flavobacterium amniphilum]MCL9807469.1 S41 family peptidase [Flavobacterium amniphilum]